MSAIVGIVRLDDQRVSTEVVNQMLATMPHRGTDGQHVWISGSVGFGHRMMHTTPESLSETLPFVDTENDITITSYARIDNRDELFELLDLPSRNGGKSISDSELILASYAKWGDNCPEHLIGDFSFAIWDGQKRKLFCARDIVGIKPMYYAYRPDEFFAFATEPKALLSLKGVTASLNEGRIADFLSLMRLDVEETVYSDISRMPPGHTLSLFDGALDFTCFGTLEPEKNVPDLSDSGYADRLRDLMYESVRCRLRSAFPVSSQLSGGLDSSFITCVAADIFAEKSHDILQTISVIFDHVTESDEREFIDAVLNDIDVSPDYVFGDHFGPLTDIDAIYDVVEDGLVGGNHHLIWRMLQKARKNGARVVLDGLDGDTVIEHGFEYFRELARDGNWTEFADQIRKAVPKYKGIAHKHAFHDVLSSPSQILRVWALPELGEMAKRGQLIKFLSSVRDLHRIFGIPKKALLRKNIFRMIIPHFVWRERTRRLDRTKSLCDVMDKGFSDRIDLRGRLSRFKHKQPVFTTVRAQQQMALNSGSLTSSFETLDFYGAAHGVDIRHPFMDIRLIRFCLAIPPNQSYYDGWTRIVMRRAMDPIVPKKVSWRPGKGNMTPGFEHGLFEFDRDRLDQCLSALGIAEKYVNVAYLKKILANKYNLTPLENTDIERVAMLSFWLNNKFPK